MSAQFGRPPQDYDRVNAREVIGYLLLVTISTLDIVFLILGISDDIDITLGLGLIGLTTFFGVLVTVNVFSGSDVLDLGEVRKSTTASIIVLFLVTLPLLIFPDNPDTFNSRLHKTIVDDFTIIVSILIGFYFGSRAIDSVVSAFKNRGGGRDSSAAGASSTTFHE